MIIETEVIRRCITVKKLHGCAWVVVQLAGQHIRDIITPWHLLAQWNHLLLKTFQNRTHMISGILQKAEQQLGGAVAGTATKAANGAVKITGGVGAGLPWLTAARLGWQPRRDGTLPVDAEKPAPTTDFECTRAK